MNIGINSFNKWADNQIKAGAADQAVMLRQQKDPARQKGAVKGGKPLVQRNMLGLSGGNVALADFVGGLRPKNAAKRSVDNPLAKNNLATGSKAYKDANNQVRSSILNMIRKELGLAANAPIKSFPESVKKAMNYGFFAKLLNSYNDWSADNGRPLSARNIKAITDAVKAEKSSKASKAAVDNLVNLGKDVADVVNGDQKLQEALRNNPKGAAQLCKTLNDDKTVRGCFVSKENSMLRDEVTLNLKDGCKNPLPVGKLTIKASGRPGEFEEVKKNVNGLFRKASSKFKDVSFYQDRLRQCVKDYGREDFIIRLGDDKKPFDMMEGIKKRKGQYVENEASFKRIDLNLSKLIKRLNQLNPDGQQLTDSKKTKIQLMEFLTQGVMTVTSTSPWQSNRFALPKGTLSLDPHAAKDGHAMVAFRFSAKNGVLSCRQTTDAPLMAIGDGTDGVHIGLRYDQNTSYLKSALSFEFGSAEGGVLKFAKVGVPKNDPGTTINLQLDECYL